MAPPGRPIMILGWVDAECRPQAALTPRWVFFCVILKKRSYKSFRQFQRDRLRFSLSFKTVNAGAKMHRLAGAKIHQRFGKKAPELGAFSSGIKPAWDYPPRYRSWQGVSVACFD
jgi:hypothetical protein